MDGILIVDKPKGASSHDVVSFVRKRFKLKKVGHAGTLDPQATGVLVLLVGNFTKRSKEFSEHNKEYQGRLTLGMTTDTLDGQGRVIEKEKIVNLGLRKIEEAFRHFLGAIEQVPPMFSALKYKGRRLYALARNGIEVRRQTRTVYINKLKITRFDFPHIYFLVGCSKGTYIRSLCMDISKKIGCAGYMSELCRLRSGPFTINQAINLERLAEFTFQELHQILLREERLQKK